ncbi:MAG TPA: alpha/beta hydrolase [Cyclobacteriaceae bacterium]|nr:alpha/beta hydrolase [Cyclobacteriaceae bacterium]
MKSTRLFIHLLFITITTVSVAQKLEDPVLLWPEGAPGATGSSDEDKPAVIPFIPETAKRNGAAVLVVPGGGFTIRAVDHEGVLVAQWLKDHGFTAFLLRYRLRPLYSRTDWLKDGQRAMQYIRSHAGDYKLSIDRVGAVGFSAGANLIADMAFHPMAGMTGASDPFERFSTNPDFLILAYGSIRMAEDVDQSVLSNFPPVFMYGTAEDAGTTKGMVALYSGLLQANVPAEAHFFRNGEHGSGFAIGDPVLGEWPELMYRWLASDGFLTSKSQCALTGTVKLDDSPLLRGMIVLTPFDQPNAPPVVVYITNTGTGELGRFNVPASRGPVEGKYKVEVRQEATRWTSNSRDPFMIKMMAKQRDNTLTDAEVKEWGDYLRKRDLSPSIDHQRVFTRQHPNDKRDYAIDIKAGVDVALDVYSK